MEIKFTYGLHQLNIYKNFLLARGKSMGFFDMWKVSGITTDAAKTSQPFHGLAEYIKTEESDIPIEAIVKCAHIFLKMRQSFDLYFNKKMQSEKTEAVKFLVAFTSYAYGKDGYQWNWRWTVDVRHSACEYARASSCCDDAAARSASARLQAETVAAPLSRGQLERKAFICAVGASPPAWTLRVHMRLRRKTPR